MATTGGEASLLYGNFNRFISHSSNALTTFKLPAKSQLLTVKFGAKTPRFLTSTFAIPPTDDHSGASDHPNSDNDAKLTSYRRRKLLLHSAILSFFFPVQEYVKGFAVEAKEMGAPDYLLIKDEIRKVLTKRKAAGVLRLVFHDAGTFERSENSGGMNGSITYELDRPENKGLNKSLKILEQAKNMIDEKSSVSWADMIAAAGAEAVTICGGPEILVQLGRLDSLMPDPEGKLPEETLDAPRLKESFQRKGFSTQELIALSGAHTIGNKGFGSPTVFDNSYYKILLDKAWMPSGGMSSMIGLPSDRALVEDEECLRWITKYAEDQDLFFEDFKQAYIKLVNSGARWKTS